jgi:tetratricopeptide (TPR) repeat protein
MVFEDMEFGSYDKAEHTALKAFELYEDGKMVQALEQIEAALEINPSNSSWHFNKALTLDAMSRFDEAVNEYELALQLTPDDLEILNSLAVDYTRTGQYDLALNIFDHIQELDSQFEPCYCNRIITYTEMGQYDLAEQMFYLAQQINPDCALCYYNIGNSLFAQGQYKKAVRCWIKTAELEPAHPQINYRVAQAYWYDGDTKRANEHFLAELRANPGDVDVILEFGLFLLEAGGIESAKEKFTRILELRPDFAPALFYLGEIAFNNADYEQSAELFNQALMKDNTLKGPYYRLAQYALLKGHKQKARAYLVSELKLRPDNADTLVSMASMFLTIGDFELSTRCLLEAVDFDNTNADAYYYLGLVSVNREQFENACELFTHALDINSSHIGVLRDSAYVYLLMGRLKQAEERINKARALAENNSDIKAVARAIRMARKIERARSFLSRFMPQFFLKWRSHNHNIRPW